MDGANSALASACGPALDSRDAPFAASDPRPIPLAFPCLLASSACIFASSSLLGGYLGKLAGSQGSGFVAKNSLLRAPAATPRLPGSMARRVSAQTRVSSSEHQNFEEFHSQMATLAGSPTTSILRSSPFVFRGSVKHISHVHNNIKAFGRSNRSRLSASTASDNGAIPRQVNASLREDIPECNVEQYKMSLESLFCYDKAVPEEIIEKPIGLSLSERMIGNNPRCTHCQAKGVVLCATCTGSGLYVDSILESQGIIVKVRCLGCGGTGNIMCSKCGGRGHL